MRRSVELICHPATPTPWVRGIAASVDAARGGELALAFVLEGDLAHLRVPPPQTPRRAERLWEHTCLEAFLAPVGDPAYYEFNFAPSGEWAAYAFARYREGAALAEDLDPAISVRCRGDRLELAAVVHLDRLASPVAHARLRLGLSAVIEGEGGALSYWALAHPAGKPDFHHPHAFALEIVGASLPARGAPQ